MPPGPEGDGYNLTMVLSVSDNLGSTAASHLGFDGDPVIIESVYPEEVRANEEHMRLGALWNLLKQNEV